jgi:hypothetical protein
MSSTIGGVTLPDVVIENEFAQAGVRSVVEFSLGGQPIVWEDYKYGKYIDLVGSTNQAWITRETLNDLLALIEIPSVSYTLDYEGDTITVRFRHEDPPVLIADPIAPRPNQGDSDYYNNLRIKLMEV